MATLTPDSRDAEPAPKSLYTRNSSGMVREVSALDMVGYNAAAAAGGTGIALAIALFYVFASFPGANLYIALPVALAVSGLVWVTFAVMSATFPRAGGDYLIGSRSLGPRVGLASHFAVFLSTIISVGLWGSFIVRIGLAPTFAIIGVTTHHPWWVHASETLSQRGWTFAFAVGAIGLISLLAMLRTKLVARVMTWSLGIATCGFLVAFLVILFTSHQSFINTINHFSAPYTHTKNTYGATIVAGAKAGLQYPSVHGYSFKGTVGAFIIGLELCMFYFWGTYLNGEMRGASRRSRQLGTMLGAGYGQSILVIVAAFVFINTAGYNFFAAANAGAYGVPVAPYYTYFASIASGSSVISIFIGLTFLGFLLPGTYINTSLVQRSLFAWSFDGLLPRRLSDVNERTRTPVLAIAVIAILGIAFSAWVIWDSNLQQVLSLTGIWLVPPIVVVGVSGLLLPSRHPEIYKNSPADWRVGGRSVLRLASAGCILLGLILGAGLMYFHTEFGVTGAATMPLALVGCVVVGVVWYALAVMLQRRRGLNLSLVYKTIPPE